MGDAILMAAAALGVMGFLVTQVPAGMQACGPNDEKAFVTFDVRQVQYALALLGSL